LIICTCNDIKGVNDPELIYTTGINALHTKTTENIADSVLRETGDETGFIINVMERKRWQICRSCLEELLCLEIKMSAVAVRSDYGLQE